MANVIKQIKLQDIAYELSAKFIQDGNGVAKQWSDITNLIGAGVQLTTDNARVEEGPDGPIGAPVTTAAAETMGKIYLVEDGALSGTCVEWITVNKNEGSYVWEKIGTTDADLVEYVKKGTYTANSNGEHTHDVNGTVTIPTISKTGKKMSATADGTTVQVSATAAAITGFGKHTTKNALGADATFSVSGGTVSGTANVPSSVSVSAGKAASWDAKVVKGVLSMNFIANIPTNVSVGNNIAVATGISAISVKANNKDYVSAITALGTPTTEDVATAVSVTSQPTITLNGNASDGIDYINTVTIGSTSAEVTGTAASAGGHTHTVKL